MNRDVSELNDDTFDSFRNSIRKDAETAVSAAATPGVIVPSGTVRPSPARGKRRIGDGGYRRRRPRRPLSRPEE